MFGKSKPPQNEKTLFQPRSVYAISKFLLIIVLFIIEKPMEYMQVTVFYLIMSHQEEG